MALGKGFPLHGCATRDYIAALGVRLPADCEALVDSLPVEGRSPRA